MSGPNYTRDSAQVEAHIASYFAHKLHSVVTDPRKTIATDELPLARIKRIMKQDSSDPHPRMICADAVPFMAFAAQLFIGHVTMIAWKNSTLRAKRNTHQLKDLKEAVVSSSKLDFLIDVVDNFEDESSDSQPNPLATGAAPIYRAPVVPPRPMSQSLPAQMSQSLPAQHLNATAWGLGRDPMLGTAAAWDDEAHIHAHRQMSSSAPPERALSPLHASQDHELLDLLMEEGSIEFNFR
jgi:histone H3/H4